MKKTILVGVILILVATVLANMRALPEVHASTRGDICRFSAAYVNVGVGMLGGIVTSGGDLAGGVLGGVDVVRNGAATGNWGPADPYRCPP